ncbi:MAG: UvrD-helicase domain-containing protein, partial [Desulfovibrionaceae bacterium]|nr:UvrD-helicase domain-containing protein [Desulfovibrionaceae bacterium]
MFIQVTASAGSGKTYQLTNRFLELLLGASATQWPPVCLKAGARRFAPAEIMAITFTNKAAAEMKERLVASLKALALEIPGAPAPGGFTPDIARRHLETIFKHYQRLQIRTIDSLLVMLARLFAVELGLAPDFETVFDASEILTPLYDRLVSRAETGCEPEAGLLSRAAAAFSGAGGFLPSTVWNERLRAVFHLLLTEPGPLATDPQPFIRLRGQSLDALAEAARVLKLGLEDAGCPAKTAFASFLDKCLTLGREDKIPDSVYAAKAELAECVLAAGRAALSPGLEAGYETFKECFAGCAQTAALTNGALDMLAFVE